MPHSVVYTTTDEKIKKMHKNASVNNFKSGVHEKKTEKITN